MIAATAPSRTERGISAVRRLAVIGGAVSLCGLVACGAPEPGTTTRIPPARERDTVVFATLADVQTLDPAESADNNSDAVVLSVYESLLTFDRKMRIVGGLAERWNVEADDVTWTFHLRSGVRFHDGTPLDAAAVKQSLDRLLAPAAARRNRSLLEAIHEVRVVDPLTIRITTAFPFSAFEPTMAHLATGIVSPAAAARWGTAYGRSAETAVGTGPFKVAGWMKDQELVLARNTDYWGGAPRLARVIYRPVPEAESRYAALEAGDVDVIKSMTSAALQRFQHNADVTVVTVPSVNSYLLKFNCGRKPFTDPRVRRAISYAIDRRQIVDNLLSGVSEVPTGPLSAVIRGGVQLGEIPYDPDKARQLLRDAGHPDGFKATITTTRRYVMGVEVAEVLAAQLQRVGIDASIDVAEEAAFLARTAASPDLDTREMYITGTGTSTADADWGLRPRFLSSDPINTSFYKNPAFDRVVLQAMKETDATKRLALYRRAEEIVYLEDPPALWLYHNHAVVASRRRVRGLRTWPLNLITFDQAYVEP